MFSGTQVPAKLTAMERAVEAGLELAVKCGVVEAILVALMILGDLVAEGAARVGRRDAELLLAHVLGRGRTYVMAHSEEEISGAQGEAFRSLVERRAGGVPLQYLTGMQEFFGLEFRVGPAVLIPRPETEHLVEAVLAWSRKQVKPLRMLDIGTGSGAIAIALAANEAMLEVVATDISASALVLARDNALRLGYSDRIRFVQSDLFGGLTPGNGFFDAIVSNPPYVPTGDAATMQREVVEHEPHMALFAGEDGMAIYRRLIPLAYESLREGGLLALEFGFGQMEAMAVLLRGWGNVRFLDDYAGIPRVALAERA